MFLYFSLALIAFAAVSDVLCYFEDIFKDSNGIFSTKFYDAIKNDQRSQLISPLSLNYALTAFSFGTDDNSLSQLRSVLNQPEGKHDNYENLIRLSYRSFTNDLRNDKNLTIATNLFLDNRFPVKKSFLSVIRNNFDAGVVNVQFSRDPNGSRNIINRFVDKKTNHLIKNIFNPGSITADTKSVLVNTVYFKSQWVHPFSRHLTKKKPFYGVDKQHKVEMMSQTGDFKYRVDSDLNAQLLELPYRGGYTFVVILPKDTYGISKVENKLESRLSDLNSSPFLDSFKQTSRQYVQVNLPKFTFQQIHDLKRVLPKMGVTDIFNKMKANFRRLAYEPIYIDQAIQQTFIIVNEYGTEGAAGTGLVTNKMNYPRDPIEFNADHPFIYIIRHDKSGTPLFVGRYSHP